MSEEDQQDTSPSPPWIIDSTAPRDTMRRVSNIAGAIIVGAITLAVATVIIAAAARAVMWLLWP